MAACPTPFKPRLLCPSPVSPERLPENLCLVSFMQVLTSVRPGCCAGGKPLRPSADTRLGTQELAARVDHLSAQMIAFAKCTAACAHHGAADLLLQCTPPTCLQAPHSHTEALRLINSTQRPSKLAGVCSACVLQARHHPLHHLQNSAARALPLHGSTGLLSQHLAIASRRSRRTVLGRQLFRTVSEDGKMMPGKRLTLLQHAVACGRPHAAVASNCGAVCRAMTAGA